MTNKKEKTDRELLAKLGLKPYCDMTKEELIKELEKTQDSLYEVVTERNLLLSRNIILERNRK